MPIMIDGRDWIETREVVEVLFDDLLSAVGNGREVFDVAGRDCLERLCVELESVDEKVGLEGFYACTEALLPDEREYSDVNTARNILEMAARN